MKAHVKDIMSNIEMNSGVTYQNLHMFPLHGDAIPGLEYFSIDEAIELRLLEVTEVSEGGSVPNLKVTNKGDRPILVLAGEELVGAKQNRLVNSTFLMGGLSSIAMPVSCVEQGRWHYRGKEFHSEKRMSSPQIRTKVEQDVKYSIKEGRGFRADQGVVWNEISLKFGRMNVQSPTMAMGDMYESYDDQLKRYTESFKQTEGQRGLIMAINGRVIGLELFDSPASLSKYFGKLLTSYALDAIDFKEQVQSINGLEARAKAWISDLMEVLLSTGPSLGLGYDIRLEGDRATGSGLLYENTVLYLSAFALPGLSGHRERSSMARSGLRRRL